MKTLLSVMLVGAMFCAFARQPAQVSAILKGVTQADAASIRKAEDALVALGKAQIPVMKTAILKATDAQKRALSGAIIRLSWGVDPMDKLTAFFKKKGWNPGVDPELLTDNGLLDVAPNCAFYSLHFREWPMAMMPMSPFKQRNVIIVPKTGDPVLYTDPKKIVGAFAQQVGSIVGREMPMVTAAWLRVSAVFSQDGYFIFRYPIDQIRVNTGTVGFVATGKATVDPKGGDKGEIVASVNFWPNRNKELEIKSITETRTVQAGVRPICQALLLLDANPTVRRMAERDLLIMGPIIKPYLDEKRKEASPELQKAIDAIWQRILRGER